MKRYIGAAVILAFVAWQVGDRMASNQHDGVVWSQEFNDERGAQPDPRQWGYDLGDGSDRQLQGWGNEELEYYTDSNAIMDGNGNLVISAIRLPASSELGCYYGACQYTSSRLTTKSLVNFKYGKIEARMKMPEGTGTWPAFWALGSNIDSVLWPYSGEIDIAEGLGRTPRTLYGTIHGPEYSGVGGLSQTIDAEEPLSSAFHVYGLQWTPGMLRWTFDGKTYHEESKAKFIGRTWVFDQPFFLMLNLAVGGGFGGAPGADMPDVARLTIDWIRVSKLAGTGTVLTP